MIFSRKKNPKTILKKNEYTFLVDDVERKRALHMKMNERNLNEI